MVDERSYYNKFLQLKQEPCSVRYGTIEYDGVRLFCNWLYELRKIFAKKVTENERFLANIVKLQHIKFQQMSFSYKELRREPMLFSPVPRCANEADSIRKK